MLHLFMDVDGVLMNVPPEGEQWTPAWYKNVERDLGFSRTQINDAFFATDGFKRVMTGKSDLTTELQEAINYMGWQGSVEQLATYWFTNDMVPNPDLIAQLAQLTGRSDTKIYLATNQPAARVPYLLNQGGLGKITKDVFCSADIGFYKKEPEFYDYIDKSLNIKPNTDQILFFDDDLPNLEQARKAGWEAIQYKRPSDFERHPLIAARLG